MIDADNDEMAQPTGATATAPEGSPDPAVENAELKDRLLAAGHAGFAISASSFGLGGVDGRKNHSGVGTAPAEIAAERPPSGHEVAIGVLAREGRAGDYEAGCAESALLGVVLDKCLLNGVHLLRGSDAFDGGDGPAFGFDRSKLRHAAISRASVPAASSVASKQGQFARSHSPANPKISDRCLGNFLETGFLSPSGSPGRVRGGAAARTR